jgi:predicted O-linked N-acetylglucosamine transferase (SPINDLY family)
LRLQPHAPELHNNLGVALTELGRLDEAGAAFRRALALDPKSAEAHNNLGTVLRDQANLSDALAAYRHALELQPGNAQTHSNLIYTLLFDPADNEGVIREEQRRWDLRFGHPPGPAAQPHANERNPERRLRIGYVSADLRDHAVGRNLLPLFQQHERESVEVVCYSGSLKTDGIAEAIRACVHLWRSEVGVDDAALAEMIRRDRIDVLVDLSQHTAGNRLPVFARRPAPVQVSFAGYPATTGVGAIGYRLSDRWLEGGVPQIESEQVHLIDSFWLFHSGSVEMEVNPLPAQSNRHVTFGSLNAFRKVNDVVLRLWARLLRSTPGSRLLLLSPPGSQRQLAADFLETEGVERGRVEFVEPRPRKGYLELYRRLDIVLDPFPYGGHTTSLDALWMGVPVVSLAGKTPVSRAGLSILNNLGLPELVASAEDDYVRIATALAADLPRLAELRSTLRHRMESSVLMDAPRFARQIEAAYRTMWREWCAAPQT